MQTPILPVPHHSPSQPAALAPPSAQQLLQDEITTLKGALQEEKELNAKRHEDLVALLTDLQAKTSCSLRSPPTPPVSAFMHPVPLFFCPLYSQNTIYYTVCVCLTYFGFGFALLLYLALLLVSVFCA